MMPRMELREALIVGIGEVLEKVVDRDNVPIVWRGVYRVDRHPEGLLGISPYRTDVYDTPLHPNTKKTTLAPIDISAVRAAHSTYFSTGSSIQAMSNNVLICRRSPEAIASAWAASNASLVWKDLVWSLVQMYGIGHSEIIIQGRYPVRVPEVPRLFGISLLVSKIWACGASDSMFLPERHPNLMLPVVSSHQ